MADVNFEPKRTRGQPTALAGGIQVSYSTVSADRLNRASKFNEFSRNPESGIRDEIRHVAKVKKTVSTSQPHFRQEWLDFSHQLH